MKGYIRKYRPDIADPYLCDDGRIADPDFFTNKTDDGNAIPTWAVCGPYLRAELKEKDVVFFLPMITQLRQIGIQYYICTGMLVVEEILPDKTAVRRHVSIDEEFKRLYSLDLADHLRNDKLRTRERRGKNIILGDRSRSVWFGKNSLDLSLALKMLGMADLSKRLASRQPKGLSTEETVKLESYLRSELTPIQDRTHSHASRKTDGVECKTCYRK